MSEVTFSISKGKVIFHKDGANLAFTMKQLVALENVLPTAKAELINHLENADEDGKKRSS